MTTVAAGLVRDVIDYACTLGADRVTLLAATETDETILQDQDARLPAALFVVAVRTAARLLDRPDFALAYGEASHFDDFSIVGLICYAADSMLEGFEQMNRYARLVLDTGVAAAANRFRLVYEDDGVWIEDLRPNPNAVPELTETVFARFIGDYDRYFGDADPNRPFRALEVTHEAPAHASAYDALFGVPVAFSASRNALLAHKSWLTLSTGPKNRYAFGVLASHADALMDRLEAAETLRGQIEHILLPILHKGDVSMEKVAEKLGLSRPTLYRKLKADGDAFDEIVDDLRQTMAIQYLEGGKASVNEVAYLVGFSETSSFSRAFKRWTGKAPSEWREGS